MSSIFLIVKGGISMAVVVYVLSTVVFYFSQDQGIWSKGPALYALAFQYGAFFVVLISLLAFTVYRFFFTTTEISWHYYVMLVLVLVNIVASGILFLLDKRRYPEIKNSVSSYVVKSPAGVTLLISELFKDTKKTDE